MSAVEALSEAKALTVSQVARRERMIEVALELLAEGGYDEVQIRDVADRSGVALGTLYRYFSSKDHLLSAALLQWSRARTARVVPASTPAERLSGALRRAAKPLLRQPQLARAYLITSAAQDPLARRCHDELDGLFTARLVDALEPIPAEEALPLARLASSAWFGNLVAWLNGRCTATGLNENIDIFCHLLLDGRQRQSR